MTLRCTCKHEAQDKIHGRGRRLHNETRKRNPTIYRCTVCGTERTETGQVMSGPKRQGCSWSDVADYIRHVANKSVSIGPPPKVEAKS